MGKPKASVTPLLSRDTRILVRLLDQTSKAEALLKEADNLAQLWADQCHALRSHLQHWRAELKDAIRTRERRGRGDADP